jgi:hypothetical protein
LGRNTSQL